MAKKKTEERAPETKTDLSDEFAELGRAVRDALAAAWNSQEREHLQSEIHTGLNKLADEMETAVKNIRQSEAAQKVEGKAKQVRDDVQSGKVAEDVRQAIAQALRSAREGVSRVSDSFTPIDAPPKKKKAEVEFEPLDMDKAKKKSKDKDE